MAPALLPLRKAAGDRWIDCRLRASTSACSLDLASAACLSFWRLANNFSLSSLLINHSSANESGSRSAILVGLEHVSLLPELVV